ncbi:uncharacterized protein N7482_006445 [Penicillium canariense]|uniref:Uncharacterized protein n=1 Tax=Penicillium canariense TaxID=189055 RepID=A0A9W9HXK3_9EURO|nr:uncharacterized protein N7482_006445 [Penicillium canariense]KAJ5159441.1 hypothetical protein N7482_006445 [Penicillium canariense]
MPTMAALLELNTLTLHYAYFILASMIGSVVLFTTSTQIQNLHFVDALFMSFNAMTGAGLNVLDLSTLNVPQQGTLFTLLILGHAIPILGIISLLRALALRLGLKDQSNKKGGKQILPHKSILQIQETQPHEDGKNTISAKNTSLSKINIAVKDLQVHISSPGEPEIPWNARNVIIVTDPTDPDQSQGVASITSIGGRKNFYNVESFLSRVFATLKSMMQRLGKILSCWSGSIGCNETNLVEYRALALISVLTIFYTVVLLCFGIMSIGFWSKYSRPDIPRTDGVSPFWAGAFLATSAFGNNGMSLINANMTPYQREWVCVSLYPGWHTFFLFCTILVLNGILTGAFELASIHNTEIEALPLKYRVLDGLFQSLCVRSGGFTVVAFDELPQGLLTLYVLMMYLPASPVSAATSRSTETTTTGSAKVPFVEADKWVYSSSASGSTNALFAGGYFLCRQISFHLGHDIWWLGVAVLLISVVESDHYKSQPVAFSTFNIIFEVVSAYSCVGVSIGYPGKHYSFCGEWYSFSKLLLVSLSLWGRHRSLSALTEKSISLCVSPEAADEEMMILQKDKAEQV